MRNKKRKMRLLVLPFSKRIVYGVAENYGKYTYQNPNRGVDMTEEVVKATFDLLEAHCIFSGGIQPAAYYEVTYPGSNYVMRMVHK